MHARHAVERRSRWEEPDKAERHSIDDATGAEHKPSTRSIGPMSMRASSGPRGRTSAAAPSPPSTPPRSSNTLVIGASSSVSSSPSLSTRAAARQSRILERNGGGSAGTRSDSSTAASSIVVGNKYHDREMRLHQSIIYNRARLKQQQKKQTLLQQQQEENIRNHATSTTAVLKTTSKKSYVSGTPRIPIRPTNANLNSTNNSLYATRSQSPSSSVSSSRDRLQCHSDRSQQSVNSSRNKIKQNSMKTMEQEQQTHQKRKTEISGTQTELSHEINSAHSGQPNRSQQAPLLSTQQQETYDLGGGVAEHLQQLEQRLKQKQQQDQFSQFSHQQQKILPKHVRRVHDLEIQRTVEQRKRLEEEERLLREQQKLLHEQEEEQNGIIEQHQHRRQESETLQEYVLQNSDDNDQSQNLFSHPDDFGETSMLSGFSKPFDERNAVDVGESSILSGYSKPFDEKQDSKEKKTAYTRSSNIANQHNQYIPVTMNGDAPNVTTNASTVTSATTSPREPLSKTSSVLSAQQIALERSQTDSTLNSSFWKYGENNKPVAPYFEQVNNAVSSYRFKLPPPRVSDPPEGQYRQHSNFIAHPRTKQHSQTRQVVSDDFEKNPLKQEAEEGEIGLEEEKTGFNEEEDRNDHTSLLEASMIANDSTSAKHSPDRSSIGTQSRISPDRSSSTQSRISPDRSSITQSRISPDRSSDGTQSRISQTSRSDSGSTRFEEETNFDIDIPSSYQQTNKNAKAPDFILNHDVQSREETEAEDDSLFGYLTLQSKQKEEKQPGGNTVLSKDVLDTSDDDDGEESTSMDTTGDPVEPNIIATPGNLQVRSQQSRKRQNELKKQAESKISEEEMLNRNKVSFGAVNTVHTYEKNRKGNTDNATQNDSTESGYTRSLESEVEGVFKDFFMFGTGSSRKPCRPKNGKSRPDDETFESVTDEGSTKKGLIGEDPLLAGVWNMMESGVGALGGVLGFFNPEDDDETTIHTEETGPTMESSEIPPPRRKPHSIPSKSKHEERRNNSMPKRASSNNYIQQQPCRSVNNTNQKKQGLTSFQSSGRAPPPRRTSPVSMERPLHTGLGPNLATGKQRISSVSLGRGRHERSSPRDVSLLEIESDFSAVSEDPMPPIATAYSEELPRNRHDFQSVRDSGPRESLNALNRRSSPPPLDQDFRLALLATEAARMFHKTRGYEFDGSQDVDIVNEIKFIVVELKLPMGVVFQENEAGCWISKIVPDGLAAQSNIAVGDQLAAIDGIAATNMKVDEIADVVRGKRGAFELTLIRYVGKLRPAVQGSDAGFEIKAKNTTTMTKKKSNPQQTVRDSTPTRKTRSSAQDMLKESSGRIRNTRSMTPMRFERQERDSANPSDSPLRERRRFGFFGRRK